MLLVWWQEGHLAYKKFLFSNALWGIQHDVKWLQIKTGETDQVSVKTGCVDVLAGCGQVHRITVEDQRLWSMNCWWHTLTRAAQSWCIMVKRPVVDYTVYSRDEPTPFKSALWTMPGLVLLHYKHFPQGIGWFWNWFTYLFGFQSFCCTKIVFR